MKKLQLTRGTDLFLRKQIYLRWKPPEIARPARPEKPREAKPDPVVLERAERERQRELYLGVLTDPDTPAPKRRRLLAQWQEKFPGEPVPEVLS